MASSRKVDPADKGETGRLKEAASRAVAQGRLAEAVELLARAQALAPKDTHVALRLAEALARLDRKAEAVLAYKRAAGLFAAAGFLIKAISVHKLILALAPDDRQVQDALTRLYAQQRGAPPGAGALELPDIDLARLDPAELPRTPLFSDLQPEELAALLEKLALTSAPAGAPICREGEPADSMFVIVRGLVRVACRDPQGQPLWLTNLGEGAFFGEFGLFSDGRRHADVVAVEDTDLLQIQRAALTELIAAHPRVQDVALAFYKERVVDTLLARSPLTRGLSPEERQRLLAQSALELHAPGSMIIQEGDDGDHLFVVKSGRVEVWSGLGGQRVVLAELGPGEIFGEIGVLTGQPTTANVESLEACELVKFSRREVLEVAARHPQLAHLLAETKERRVRETVRRLQLEGLV